MAKPLSRAILLLLLLGSSPGAGRGDTCRLGPYGLPLPDDSEECALQRAPKSPQSPGKARAADPPAKETSGFWIRLGAWAQEASHSSSEPPEAGILLVEGELCHQWGDGQVAPTETFHCPTQGNHRQEMFCCGTCTASYCCSSLTERLDQASCSKVRSAGQEPEGVAPTVRSIDARNFLGFFGIAAVALCTFFSVLFCALRYWIMCLQTEEEQTQLDLIRGAPGASGAQPGWLVTPDPLPSLMPELAVTVANEPWRHGNRLPGMSRPAIFFLTGPQRIVPEEEKEEEAKEEEKEEEEEEKEEEEEAKEEEKEEETAF